MAKQIIIQSTNANDTPTDIEEKLEKAYTSIALQRERKEFTDPFLRDRKTKADKVVTALLQNMIEEIAAVLR